MQTFFSHSGYGYSKRLCENVSLWFLKKYQLENALIDIIHRGLKREEDRKSTRLNSSHVSESRMPSSA